MMRDVVVIVGGRLGRNAAFRANARRFLAKASGKLSLGQVGLVARLGRLLWGMSRTKCRSRANKPRSFWRRFGATWCFFPRLGRHFSGKLWAKSRFRANTPPVCLRMFRRILRCCVFWAAFFRGVLGRNAVLGPTRLTPILPERFGALGLFRDAGGIFRACLWAKRRLRADTPRFLANASSHLAVLRDVGGVFRGCLGREAAFEPQRADVWRILLAIWRFCAV